MLNIALIKVANDQCLFKLLLGPLKTFLLHDASAWAQKYFRVYRVLDASLCFFLEVSVSTIKT